MEANSQLHEAELVPLSELREHPRNYRTHPEDQLDHLVASIQQHGFYRNVVIASDGTVLAGHGVLMASRKLKLEAIPCIRLDVGPDDPRAIKVMTGDNTLSHLAVDDDRVLTDLLRELSEQDELLGTGFDDKMLAAMAMVTRPASEIADVNEAAEWGGLPGYEPEEMPYKIVVNFRNAEDRDKLVKELEWNCRGTPDGKTWAVWYPPKEREDVASIKFEG